MEVRLVAVWNLVVRCFSVEHVFAAICCLQVEARTAHGWCQLEAQLDLMEAETGYWFRAEHGTSGGLQRLSVEVSVIFFPNLQVDLQAAGGW